MIDVISTVRLVMALGAAVMLVVCGRESCRDPTEASSGVQLFQMHCASCHGADARGNGPVARFSMFASQASPGWRLATVANIRPIMFTASSMASRMCRHLATAYAGLGLPVLRLGRR